MKIPFSLFYEYTKHSTKGLTSEGFIKFTKLDIYSNNSHYVLYLEPARPYEAIYPFPINPADQKIITILKHKTTTTCII